jgi:H+/Cl- antiporter ClcA
MAMIAITTSSSMSVNAEEGLFILIFIGVFFSFCGVFRVRARLRRTSSEGFLRGLLGLVVLGLLLGVGLFWGEHLRLFA